MGKRNVHEAAEVAVKPPVSDREKQWLEDEIEVEFYNLEEPGLMNKFPYGSTKNFKNYTLMHGGKYKLPCKYLPALKAWFISH